MKFSLPSVPLWAIVLTAALIGVGSIGLEVFQPRASLEPAVENHAGFFAASGFAAAFVVLAGGRLVRLLCEKAPEA